MMRLVYPSQAVVKKYSIPIPRFRIGYWDLCSSRQPGIATITWDTSKTTVTGAVLVLTAVSDHGAVLLDGAFNEVAIPTLTWEDGEEGQIRTFTKAVDLRNGTNLLEVWACKIPWLGLVRWLGEAYLNILDSYIEVTFEGEEPTRPWYEILSEWFMANWPYVALAGAVVVGGVVIYKTIRR